MASPRLLLIKFIEKISKFYFFKNLSETNYRNLFLKYEKRIYKPNTIIYKEGDEIDGIYLIIKGECTISKRVYNRLLFNEEKNKFKFNEKTINMIPITGGGINNNNKQNNLLTITQGDIFGDLEINKNANKRLFSVISSNFMKTKVWFFSIDIIRHFYKNIHGLSNQKYEIIKTRLEFNDFIEKIKKQNFY